MRGRRRVLSILACATAVAAVGATSAHGAGTPSQATLPPATPPGTQPLSNERTETRWAYPERRAVVYSRPSSRARKVGRLRLLTEDQFPELYVVLARWVDPANGNTWLRIRIPKRPNGRTGWVPASALGSLTVNRKMIDVDKRRLRLTVFDRGQIVMTARIGVGKKGTITPSGHFYVREKFHVNGVPLYGPRAIGTSAYAPTLSDWPGGGVVGLHGTNQPGLIPGRPSHGCIRLRNRDILRLYRLAERGTPINIHN
jgi:lipoprotein-anchoring transpeptidase ErfK/SrfK